MYARDAVLYVCYATHSGENQAEIIIQVIKEFQLEDQIGYFVIDNTSNNDTAIEAILITCCLNLTLKQRLARRL